MANPRDSYSGADLVDFDQGAASGRKPRLSAGFRSYEILNFNSLYQCRVNGFLMGGIWDTEPQAVGEAAAFAASAGAGALDDALLIGAAAAPAGPWDAYRANDGAAWAGGTTPTAVTTTVAVSGAYDSISEIHRATSVILSPTPTSGVGTNGDDPPYLSLTDGTLWWTGSAGSHLGLEWRYNVVDATGPSTSLLELDYAEIIRIVYHDDYTAGDSAGWDPADAV